MMAASKPDIREEARRRLLLYDGGMGKYPPEEFDAACEAKIQGLVDGGVDLISIETMYSLQEALSALRAARKISGLPVSVCMTFDRNPRGFFTLMGEKVPDCMRALE